MIGVAQILMHHVTSPRPFRVVCHP